MGALIDSAAAILSQSEQRVGLAAQNMSNMSTPGYKRRTEFQSLISQTDASKTMTPSATSKINFEDGKTIQTGNPYDLAITGPGFFVVRSGERVLYTRQGQFSQDGEGRLATAQGYVLQAEGSGDLKVNGQNFKVLDDATVIQDGQPIGRLQIAGFQDLTLLTLGENGFFAAPSEAATDIAAPSVKQGELEASNVSTGDEMVAMMQAVRRAETAQRLINVYDDLIGRALTAFAQ